MLTLGRACRKHVKNDLMLNVKRLTGLQTLRSVSLEAGPQKIL
jgi:hypothetical protein